MLAGFAGLAGTTAMTAAATAAAVTVALEGMADARALYARARPRYAPRKRVPPVEWIESHFVISKDSGAATPGPYRFSAVPWWREVVETLADDVTERVVVAKSSQVGYTEMLLAWLAYCAVNDPSSALLIQPTIGKAEEFSKERLEPVIREVKALRDVIRRRTQGMARSSDDTLLRKAYAGGWLALGGANSPAGLASRPVRRVIGDELDRWPFSAGDEGSPLELARKRTITYWNRKIVAGGTPVAEGASPTWGLWELSDQRHWMMPCPHCGERIRFRWKDDDGAYLFVFERDAQGEVVPESVQYRCERCACLIDESDKPAMVAAGQWEATHPGRKIRGYHIWAAYSSFCTWAELCDDFLKAHGVENDLKVFVNTMLGLPFAPKAEKIDPGALSARAEPLGEPAEPPPEVGLLTAGVDVQADRLEFLVCGWGARERLVVLEYGQVDGDPGQTETWDALTAELARVRGDLRVTAAAVDTSYRPETGWSWAERRLPFRVFPVRGKDGRGLLMQKPGAVTYKRQRRPWFVSADSAKDSLAARLRSDAHGPQGVRFADVLPSEYYDHLTAEKLGTVYVAGRPVRKWQLIAGRRNEGLDMTVYALAALHGLGAAVIARLGDLADARAAKASSGASAGASADAGTLPSAPAVPPPKTVIPRPLQAPRRGGFVNRWR